MTQRLTQANIESIAKERKHTLISLSNPENPRDGRKGLVKILCFCGHVFETKVHSYLYAKNGCPNCKSENLKLNNPNKGKQVSRKNKEIEPKQPFFSINSREKLILHLKNNPNKYNDFILEKINEENNSSKTTLNDKNKHHIIPKHAGGADKSWNMVMLTTLDHQKAHELRFEVYQEKGERDAVRLPA